MKSQEREGSTKGRVKRNLTESESQDASLAYLLRLALADVNLDPAVQQGIEEAMNRRTAFHGSIGLLSDEVAPLARALNVEPALLALMIYHRVHDRDQGATRPAGLEDWYGLSDLSQELRAEILAQTKELVADLDFSVGHLNEDVEACIALAIKKAVDIKARLEVLKKKVAAEFGRRRKLFHHYSKRDLEAYYLRRMRGLPPSDPQILNLYNDASLNLSVKENRDRVQRYASDRISRVAAHLNSFVSIPGSG